MWLEAEGGAEGVNGRTPICISNLLKKNGIYYNQLNKILEQIIFRLLGIDKSLEKRFLLNQKKFSERKIQAQ